MNAQEIKWTSKQYWFDCATRYEDGTYSVEVRGGYEAYSSFADLMAWALETNNWSFED